MAYSIPWNMIAVEASGDLAGFTLYTDMHGRKVVFPKTPPEVPETPNQRRWRDRFRAAVLNWKAAPHQLRAAFEAVSLKASLCMTGHNLWVSLSLTQDAGLCATLARQTGIPIELPPPVPWPPLEITRTPDPPLLSEHLR